MISYIMDLIDYTIDPRLVLIAEAYLDNLIPQDILTAVDQLILNLNINNIYYDLIYPISKSVSIFGSNCYVYYIINNKYYVDINHIISCMTTSADQYKELFYNYSEYIYTSIWDIGLHGKPFYRELIDLNTMGRLILSYNCLFSQLFIYECLLYLFIIRILKIYELMHTLITN